jgi:peptide methionine sulfoxide reductase MsrB
LRPDRSSLKKNLMPMKPAVIRQTDTISPYRTKGYASKAKSGMYALKGS